MDIRSGLLLNDPASVESNRGVPADQGGCVTDARASKQWPVDL